MHDRIKSRARRQIPAVARILDALGHCDLPRPVVVDLVRRKLSEIRAERSVPEFESIMVLVRRSLDELRASKLQPIINGTGIIIHTNFGRAPLPPNATRALGEIGSGYSNLEYDLVTGGRGHRGAYVENAVARLCGAESATIVNNCAAALVLITHHFAGEKLDGFKPSSSRRSKSEVIVSRGELVQIGGGFRIGEIIEATGAELREVGATNKTTLNDYAEAIGPNTGLILKVHRSNFFMSGFVESPSSEQICALAHRKRVPFVEDLGSGAIVATEQFGTGDHEPMPAEVLKSGVDLVCFSGDKLFGAALQATVDLYLDQKTAEIPTLALLRISEDELRARAAAICDQSSKKCSGLQIASGRGTAKTGGGTLPKSNLPSVTIDIVPKNSSLADFAATLRAWNPPVIGYIAGGRFKLDLRTIFPAPCAPNVFEYIPQRRHPERSEGPHSRSLEYVCVRCVINHPMRDPSLRSG